MNRRQKRHGRGVAKLLALAALAGVAPAACDILDTDTPDIIAPEDLDSPEGAEARRLGAISDFAFVMDGDGTQFEDGRTLLSGLLADEFVLSTTPPSEQDFDQRRIGEANPGLVDVFLNLHRARKAAEDAAAALEAFGEEPASDPGISEMLSLAGFVYVAFAEDFCSGVPVSVVEGDEVVFGEPLTTAELLGRALERFDAARAHPGATEELVWLAEVGRGRALLDLGRFDEAAAAVAGVPDDFRYETEHADTPLRSQNAIWSYGDSFLWSVGDAEGGNGLPFASAGDPRVPVDDTGETGLDGQTPQFTLLKYADPAAPVTVADGTEARLIEAEARLRAGDLAGMTARLNALRSEAGMPPLSVPGGTEAAVDLLFAERAAWLFATGHRLGDLRRLVRQYGREPEAVFPTGAYHKGGTYGTDVNMPIPIEERNNPNSQGCLDRNA